jgi:hypothetical protein
MLVAALGKKHSAVGGNRNLACSCVKLCWQKGEDGDASESEV